MTKFDICFLGVIGISCLVGVVRGLTKELLSLLSWCVSIGIAYFLFPFTQNIARNYINNPMIADAVGVFSIFIIVLTLMTLISHALSSWVKHSALSGVDRSLGFAYGIIRACLLLFVFELVISCVWSRPEYPEIISNTRFASFMYKGSDLVYSLLPTNLKIWVRKLQDKKKSENSPTIDDIKQMTHAVGRISELKEPFDREGQKKITAEELADLKPREVVPQKSVKKSQQAKQDVELERLLDQTTDDKV